MNKVFFEFALTHSILMNDNEFVYVPFDTLLKLQTDAFAAMGVPEADAKICAEVLFEGR